MHIDFNANNLSQYNLTFGVHHQAFIYLFYLINDKVWWTLDSWTDDEIIKSSMDDFFPCLT